MSTLLSIDPGTHHYGLAYWTDGILWKAWWAKKDACDVGGLPIDVVACERPQVYLMNLKAANDMVVLALSVGELVGRICEAREPEVVYYLPSQWKGNVKKEIHHPRVLDALSPAERERIELPRAKKSQLDVLDAVGIGLHHLGRLVRGSRRAA